MVFLIAFHFYQDGTSLLWWFADDILIVSNWTFLRLQDGDFEVISRERVKGYYLLIIVCCCPVMLLDNSIKIHRACYPVGETILYSYGNQAAFVGFDGLADQKELIPDVTRLCWTYCCKPFTCLLGNFGKQGDDCDQLSDDCGFVPLMIIVNNLEASSQGPICVCINQLRSWMQFAGYRDQ